MCALMQTSGTTWTQDKWPAQRHEDLRNALLAWQTNPLARRIVNLTRDHVGSASAPSRASRSCRSGWTGSGITR